MPDEELTLILKLRDEATKQMKKRQGWYRRSRGRDELRRSFKAGAQWDKAT